MVSKISQDVSDILATDKSGYGVDYKSLSREVAYQTELTCFFRRQYFHAGSVGFHGSGMQ